LEVVDGKVILSEVMARNWVVPEVVMSTGTANCILALVEFKMEIGEYF